MLDKLIGENWMKIGGSSRKNIVRHLLWSLIGCLQCMCKSKKNLNF